MGSYKNCMMMISESGLKVIRYGYAGIDQVRGFMIWTLVRDLTLTKLTFGVDGLGDQYGLDRLVRICLCTDFDHHLVRSGCDVELRKMLYTI